MPLVPFTKPHATALQRVTHLRSKGLDIPRPTVAAQKIDLIGYERLRIYFLSRRQLGVPGRPFQPNISYHHILKLYEADSLLRETIFRAVGQFEILIRNSISETLSHNFGSHPYFTSSAFKDPKSHLEAIQSFANIYKKSKDARAKHYADTYGDPIMPPIWVLKEFMTFGSTAIILKSLAGPIRTNIASSFGVNKDTVFISWVECLVDLRNICAHHDRLFNRKFQKQPNTLSSASIPTAPAHKLKAILECLDYMTARRGAGTRAVADAQKIISKYTEIQPAEAGF